MDEEEEEEAAVVVHNSATKSGVVNNFPKWLRRLRHTRSKQSEGAWEMARAHSAVVAGPEVLNFNTLSAHLAGLDAEVL